MTEQNINARLAHELSFSAAQIERTVALLDEGNTIPFITRYRKEVTGGLDEEQLRKLAERLQYLRNLEARRAEVHKALEDGGHLTPELDAQLAAAETLQAIEDIYLPFRPKRRRRARHRGRDDRRDGGGAPGRARGHPPHRRGARCAEGRGRRRRRQIPAVPRVRRGPDNPAAASHSGDQPWRARGCAEGRA